MMSWVSSLVSVIQQHRCSGCPLLSPIKAKTLKTVLPTVERCEENLRRQRGIIGNEPITDGAKRVMLIRMLPDDLANHI